MHVNGLNNQSFIAIFFFFFSFLTMLNASLSKHAQMGALSAFYSAVVSGPFISFRNLCGSAPLLLSCFPFNVLFPLSFSWIILLLKSLSWALSPDLFLHVIFLSPSLRRFPQRWFFWPSLLPRSLPDPPPALPPLPKHLCMWQVREQRHSPGAPPLPFLLLFLSSFFFRWCCPSLTLSHLPLPHSQPPPPSPLYSVNLFALSPSGSHLSLHLCSFFLYISVLTPLLTSVKLPLLPSHLSSVLLFKPSPLLSSPLLSSPLLSSLWQHLPISLLWSPSFPSFILVPCSSPDL